MLYLAMYHTVLYAVPFHSRADRIKEGQAWSGQTGPDWTVVHNLAWRYTTLRRAVRFYASAHTAAELTASHRRSVALPPLRWSEILHVLTDLFRQVSVTAVMRTLNLELAFFCF